MDEGRAVLPNGTLLKNNRYEITGVLGAGGFGVTYRAVDRMLGFEVALKECRVSFRREAQILDAVKDVPYIARLRDHFSENGTEYMALNIVQGQSLLEYAKVKGGKLPAQEVLELFKNIFDTISKLHGLGIIHRDICPGNLMLSKDGGLYLIDFGSATSFDGRQELKSGQVFTHRGLDAPERLQSSRQGPWTDIFSLCATIVCLITGEKIADANDRRQYDNLPQILSRSALSSRQQNALMRGLNPDIKRRYSDVGRLYEELYGEPLAPSAVSGTWRVFYHARTFIGTKKINQDNFMVDSLCCYKGEDCEYSGFLECAPSQIHLAAVCDGVGGSNHGELASKAAVQALIHFAEEYPERDEMPDRLLEELLDQVNEKLLQLGVKIGQTATTLSLLLWWGDRYCAANIGDSPIFIMRKGKLRRISASHTKAAMNMELQSPVQGADWNTLVRYLGKNGVAGSQMAAFSYGRLQAGDVFLICSDGVSKKTEASRLKACLSKNGTKSLDAIFKSITRNKENDNCTAVVLKF